MFFTVSPHDYEYKVVKYIIINTYNTAMYERVVSKYEKL